MYKDDNMTPHPCNDELLRMVLSGGPNQGIPSPAPSEGCGDGTGFGISGYPLASVYAPLQKFDNLYDEKTALKQGTLFMELDLPFGGTTVKKGGNCCG